MLKSSHGGRATLKRKPAPAASRELPWRTGTVTQGSTACFDPQAVFALAAAYRALEAEHGAAATEAAFADPEALAAWECRWLHVGTRVQVHGGTVNAVGRNARNEFVAIEGITVYVCADHACRRDDPSGLVPGPVWYPLAMLRID